jgi:hypothetical protein
MARSGISATCARERSRDFNLALASPLVRLATRRIAKTLAAAEIVSAAANHSI